MTFNQILNVSVPIMYRIDLFFIIIIIVIFFLQREDRTCKNLGLSTALTVLQTAMK